MSDETLARYEIVAAYMNNQTETEWQHLVSQVVKQGPQTIDLTPNVEGTYNNFKQALLDLTRDLERSEIHEVVAPTANFLVYLEIMLTCCVNGAGQVVQPKLFLDLLEVSQGALGRLAKRRDALQPDDLTKSSAKKRCEALKMLLDHAVLDVENADEDEVDE